MSPKTVSLISHNAIGIISINYPPVNALSQQVRQGIINGIKDFQDQSSIKAIIIQCEGRTFIAGADIKEFGKAPLEPFLPDVVNAIEASKKPVIASIFGTALGGGFEVALACHYRVALGDSKVGLPEVNLGLIPGAGGTQRLPRIIGTHRALDMVISGKHYEASSFKDSELFDAVFENGLERSTLEYVEQLLENGELNVKAVGKKSIRDDIDNWVERLALIEKKARGKTAPVVAAKLIEKTRKTNILEGMSLEREAFVKLRDSEQSKALRFAFSAERIASKTVFDVQPLDLKQIAIIGGGTMGSGIATAFLSAGFETILIEQNDDVLAKGKARIEENFAVNVNRKRMSKIQTDSYLKLLRTSTDYQLLSNCDLVIEAVFENMDIKQTIFSQLDKICKKECILATNTSYLDIDEIASVISRPEQVIGMHFFSPANIMKLLEIVQAKKSSQQALVTAMAIAKKLKKISVLVGVCFGFAGNRMYTRYGREIQQMLMEGAEVKQIDSALTNWGMAMGPLAVADMSGIDIGYHARSSQPFPEYDRGYFKPSELMFEQGRFGRKTGAGYYDYDESGKSVSNPSVAKLIQDKAEDLAIVQQSFSEEEIVNRALLALISEGLQLLQDGIVQRASDIDVIWLHGYGFPRHKGGPMFQAKQMGKEKLSETFQRLRESEGILIWPEVDLSLLME